MVVRGLEDLTRLLPHGQENRRAVNPKLSAPRRAQTLNPQTLPHPRFWLTQGLTNMIAELGLRAVKSPESVWGDAATDGHPGQPSSW